MHVWSNSALSSKLRPETRKRAGEGLLMARYAGTGSGWVVNPNAFAGELLSRFSHPRPRGPAGAFMSGGAHGIPRKKDGRGAARTYITVLNPTCFKVHRGARPKGTRPVVHNPFRSPGPRRHS